LEVVCPKCNAAVGRFCAERRPSGHRVRFVELVHNERDQLAMDLGFLQKCPGPPTRAKKRTGQRPPQLALP